MDEEKAKQNGGDEDRGDHRPRRLTERQRAEARRARRRRPARTARKRAGGGNPLNRGVRAFLAELGRAVAFIAGLIPALFNALGSAARSLLEAVIFIGERLLGLLIGLGRTASGLLAELGRAVNRLDQILTPVRAAALICLLGGLALAGSQFIDYRATEIGGPEYVGVLDLTSAPRVDVLTPLQTHSVLVLVLAVVGVVGTLTTLITGRGRPAALVALAGLVSVIVSVAVDLPRGLELGEAEIAYADAVAVLLGGFWLQLAGGVILAIGGLVLWATGSAPATAPARADRLARGAV